MDKNEAIRIVQKYKELVIKHFAIEYIILFGSYAKGNFRADSDIDVAVVVRSIEGDYLSCVPLLWRLRREIDNRIEPILIESTHDESGFLENILQTGVII